MTPDDFSLWADVLPEPTLLATHDGRVLAANRAVRRLGLAPDSIVGRTLTEFATDPPGHVADFLHSCARSADMVPGSLTVTAGGRTVPCRCEGAALRPAKGKDSALLIRVSPKDATTPPPAHLAEQVDALAREVTRRRQAEADLREADRRKTEFLGILAHELRNPLVPIVNWLHILQTPGVTAAMDGQARTVIARQVGQMSRLVDDLVDIARLLRDKIELKRERVDLAAAVAAAVETARPQIDAARHQFVSSLPADPVHLHADPARLTQIVGILLSNAAKYTDAGGRITLSADRGAAAAEPDAEGGPPGAFVEVRVRDTGIGIPADARARIFEPFVHEERVPGRHVGGLGVGLTLVKRLVERHGGTISVRSEGLGKGSEFVVRLPLPAE